MKYLLIPALLLAGGCGMFTDTAKSQIGTLFAVHAAGEYEFTYVVKKDGKVLRTQTVIYECTSDGVELTGCHKQGKGAE